MAWRMKRSRRGLVAVEAALALPLVLLLVLGAYEVRAQPPGGFASGTDIQFNAGQHIQPIFDGWTRNADGSFQLHFGYLNRNYVEQIHVPIGPANTIEPDGLYRFGNAITTLLIPQRGLLLGMGLAVIVFTLIWRHLHEPVPAGGTRWPGARRTRCARSASPAPSRHARSSDG